MHEQEKFDKEIATIKKTKTEISELKNTINELKNSIESFKSRFKHAEKKSKPWRIGYWKLPKEKEKIKNSKESLWKLYDNEKKQYVHHRKSRRKKKGTESNNGWQLPEPREKNGYIDPCGPKDPKQFEPKDRGLHWDTLLYSQKSKTKYFLIAPRGKRELTYKEHPHKTIGFLNRNSSGQEKMGCRIQNIERK